MTDWLPQLAHLPTVLLVVGLVVIMMLDAIPLVGVLVPGDAAVLLAIGTTGWLGGAGALIGVVAGCLAGWSLGFAAGRYLGGRIRRGRVGGWIGAGRWAAAERAVSAGGGHVVTAAPFLPVLNTIVPVVAGALRMPYRRFIVSAGAGAAMWAGLYVALGTATRALGDLLPPGPVTTGGTVAIGMTVGWLVLLRTRRGLVPAPRRPETISPSI